MTPGPPAGPAIGVDVGGTKVLGVALDAAGAVVAEARVPTPHAAVEIGGPTRSTAGAAVAEAVGDVVETLVRETSSFGPVGVGIPGMLNREGVLVFSPNLPGAAGADMGRLLGERLGPARCAVDNDANCAALAEARLGAARGAEHCVVVTLGTGIGGGLVVDGLVRRGARGFAGEIGHMVVDPSGPPCPCGGRGCWERFASGDGLVRLAREAAQAGTLHEVVALAGGDPESVRGEHVTRAALAGDPGALAVVVELGWWVALGLANLTALLDPQRIVVAGGLAAAGDLLLGPVRAAFAGLVEGAAARPPVEVVAATFAERAGAVGAALLALDAP